MLKRLSVLLNPIRGYKDEIPVKWVRPEFLPAYNPKRSGDLEAPPSVPSDTIALEFRNADELKDAPELVRKLFSVAHMGGRAANMVARRDMMERVKRHQYDEDNPSPETRIARLTAEIRTLQTHMGKYPKESQGKVTCQELIDKRKKLLKFMRKYDYRLFEWLLEKLNIEYKGSPDSFHKLTRKESLRKLTSMHCEDIRNRKLADYRHLLESQQGPFLKNKLADLVFIRSEQQALLLPITVTQQHIKQVQDALQEWQLKDDIRQAAIKKKKTKRD